MNRLFILVLVVVGCAPGALVTNSANQQRKILQLTDKVYENSIKTVRLFPAKPGPELQMQPAVTRMGDWSLVLEFDDLHSDSDTYYVRIIHCNQDWTKSTLSDLDFLSDFNEFPINQYEFSLDTWIPYVHYYILLPAVKLPGNYVAVVHRGSDKEDIILSKRFMVYDSRITFIRNDLQITSGSAAIRNQQINFTINYKNLPLINPLETVNVSIRQNQRWDNVAQGLKPSFLRENIQELEYRFFEDNTMLKGGNEFRFFDIRSLNYPGRNVASMDKGSVPWTAYLEKDKNRSHEPYSQYPDYNGSFMLDNYDYRRLNASNYVTAAFTLSSPEPVPGDVYVMSSFTQWNMDDTNKMRYDSAKREYTSFHLLKQGWYDYQYVVKSKELPSYYFEGTYFQTENLYEIFVYYRSFQPMADLLIGYVKFEENPR